MPEYAHPDVLVYTSWVAEHLTDPKVRIVESDEDRALYTQDHIAGAAVDAMRLMIDTVSMRGTVVIGEGEKDEAPMLFNGEAVGDGTGAEVDVAVDPIDGTRLTSIGQPNAVSVIALAERGSMFFPGVAVYMEKIATGPAAAHAIDIAASPAENIRNVAKAKGVRPQDIVVVVLDRDRHAPLIGEIRGEGAKVFLITDGDVAGAIAAATSERSGIDLLMGIGGTPEGVVAAVAVAVAAPVVEEVDVILVPLL